MLDTEKLLIEYNKFKAWEAKTGLIYRVVTASDENKLRRYNKEVKSPGLDEIYVSIFRAKNE